jgi:2-phospho-L-lactate/phosphoenolpyruvate guanylyltransferase
MSDATTLAIVPVKALGKAKRRLAPVLPETARARLVLTMLQDVLAAIAGADAIKGAVVVTPDPQVAQAARAVGAAVLAETRAGGLNAALRRGLGYAAAQGAAQALVLPGDVPLATAEDLRKVLATGAAPTRSRAALVPSTDGDGTNALLLAPPDAMEPSFGPGSFVRHLAQAVAQRLDAQVLQLPRLALDIDRPADLVLLLESEAGSRYSFLAPYRADVAGPQGFGAREDK